MAALDNFTLIGLPYAALVIFFIGTIYRYKATKFSYSSLSSQFLEGRQLFWGTMPFHWGLLVVFLGHLAAFLVPKSLLAFNTHPVRLLILEVSAFMFAVIVLAGLLTLFVRRVANPRLKVVTTRMDLIVAVLLIVEVVLGMSVALGFRWGSSWFAAVLTPYLRSIAVFQPDISAVASLPWLVKLHIIGAFLIFLLIPFSRLVHLLVVPLHYIWRPYQRVIWSWNRKQIRHPDNEWSATEPTNT
ncbi:MAG: respiratory nitrate reductase subunit gamma [Candidatus Krumholzibacteriia bacterium]